MHNRLINGSCSQEFGHAIQCAPVPGTRGVVGNTCCMARLAALRIRYVSTRDSDSVPRAYPCSLPDRQAHTPVTAKPRARPSPPLNSPPALPWPCLQPLMHPGSPPHNSLSHRPPRCPPQCSSNRTTYASHPPSASAHTTCVAGLADGSLPCRRSSRRRRRSRCHRSCHHCRHHCSHSSGHCCHHHSHH